MDKKYNRVLSNTTSRVIITGSNGFLGGCICEEFYSHGWDVVGIDLFQQSPIREIKSVIGSIDSPAFDNLLSDFRPDLIIHAAGTASVQNSLRETLSDFNTNVSLNAGMLDKIRRIAPDTKVLFLSSAAVYGNPQKLPIHEDAPLNPISPYGYHKFMAEKILQEYFEIFDIKSSILRIFSAYGPGLKKQILWDICTKASRNDTIVLHGTGAETRDFIHKADIARAVMLISRNSEFSNEVFNLASGIQTSTKTVAEILLNSLNFRGSVSFSGQNRPGDPLYWQADIAKITQRGFSSTVDISTGLEEYARWFRENE